MPTIAISSAVPSDRLVVDSSFHRLCHSAAPSSMAIFTLPISVSLLDSALASATMLGTAIRPSGTRLQGITRIRDWATVSTLTPTYPTRMMVETMAAGRPEMGQYDGGPSLKLNGSVNIESATIEAAHTNRKMSGNSGKGVGLQILYGRFHTPVTCRSGGKG